MAKLNLTSQVSAQVAELFTKALTSKSATNMIGLRITVDPTETLSVDINGSNVSALLGWTTPGKEAKEVWTSWLTRRSVSAETGEVFTNDFIIDDKGVKLSPQNVIETIISNDLLLENVVYHHVLEATFSSTGKKTGEEEVKRPFFVWRVLPRREIPAKKTWSQEILSRLSGEDNQTPEQEPEKAPAKSSKKATTTAKKDDTSDDVPF